MLKRKVNRPCTRSEVSRQRTVQTANASPSQTPSQVSPPQMLSAKPPSQVPLSQRDSETMAGQDECVCNDGSEGVAGDEGCEGGSCDVVADDGCERAMRSAGQHGDTVELVAKLLPILQANNVDLYINGHDHCLQHISSPDSPLQFLTSGGGSKAWRGDVSWWDPKEMKLYYDGQGPTTFDIDRTKCGRGTIGAYSTQRAYRVPLKYINWNSVPKDVIESIWKEVKTQFNEHLSKVPEHLRTTDTLDQIFCEMVGKDGKSYCQTYSSAVSALDKQDTNPSYAFNLSTIIEIAQQVKEEVSDASSEHLFVESVGDDISQSQEDSHAPSPSS
ncbi:hypothetical protein TEA_018390 [Camellia sinensis var. sinensis]|uniref:Calcineurin-like phosphoesterase domain-containing protein n=1 Tax=Camellia sinensis var. sinensis TaxID=542762 RepID=A0A4V3WIR4_CAMSN|nr:hypothetical protein TEA_018390 [Camellia sinensis var. sinensis]